MTKMIIQLTLSVIFYSGSVWCDQVYRTWIVNTKLTVGSRYWDSLVTLGSYTFNGTMTHAVAIPTIGDDLDEFCELIYPLDKLSMSASDQLPNTTAEGTCIDEEIVKKLDRVYWLDPRNWKTTFDPYSSITTSNELVPHIERVPCDFDIVKIPNTTSTFVILPPNPVTLSILRFGDSYISPYSIKIHAKDEYFLRHFIVKSTVDLVDMFNITTFSGCEDRTGCVCGTAGYKTEICAFVQDDCTKELPCKDPIRIIGHCCKICGARVSIGFDDETFVYKKLEPVVQKFVNTQSQNLKYEVDMHMSKISDYRVQVVLMAKYEYSADPLNDLAEGLATYLNKPSNLGVLASYAIVSGKEKVDHRVWSMVGTIIIGSAIALVTGFLVMYAKKQNWLESTMSFLSGSESTPLEKDKIQQCESSTTITKDAQDTNDTQENGKRIEIEPLPDLENRTDFIDISD